MCVSVWVRGGVSVGGGTSLPAVLQRGRRAPVSPHGRVCVGEYAGLWVCA